MFAQIWSRVLKNKAILLLKCPDREGLDAAIADLAIGECFSSNRLYLILKPIQGRVRSLLWTLIMTKKKNGAPNRGAIFQNRATTLLRAGQGRMRKCGFIRKAKCPVYCIGRGSHFEPLQ